VTIKPANMSYVEWEKRKYCSRSCAAKILHKSDEIKTHRVCSSCKKLLPFSEYYKNKSIPSGHIHQCKDCNREYRRGREAPLQATRRSLAKYPEKRKARSILRYFLVKNPSYKPSECSVCNRTGRIHGHHNNYDKPLEVIWVCPRCHTDIHKETK
jgi:hypothetical protein